MAGADRYMREMMGGAPRAAVLGAVMSAVACKAHPGVGGVAADPGATRACGSPEACEQRAAAGLEAVRNDPAALAKLLQRFPKGADL